MDFYYMFIIQGESMKILYIGNVKSSYILLRKLTSMQENIVGVLTTRDSSINADHRDLSNICKENRIDYKIIKKINTLENIEYIQEKKPDIIYCFGFSQLICKEILDIPPKGVIGFHPTKLPRNRGRHPLIWTLVLGLKETASTFFYIKDGIDNGGIVSQEEIVVKYSDDANDLYNRVMEKAEKQVEMITQLLKKDNVPIVIQDEDKANSWRRRNKLDGRIDWRMSSLSIYNLVRALAKPYVGAHFNIGDKEIKVWKAEEYMVENLENIEPGKIIKVYSENSFLVKTGLNAIKITNCDKVSLEVGDYL